jgi:hypothetical protein
MQLLRVAVLLVGFTLAGALAAAQPTAREPKPAKNNIWKDEPKETPPPWWQRELSEDTIARIMKGIQLRDPALAERLNELHKKDPARFNAQVREQGQPEMEQIIRERFEARRLERNAKFVEWLKANYPKEEQTLATLKDRSPQLYISMFDRLLKEYGYIYEADSSNPEMGAVLKEDRELKKRADDLCRQLRREKSEAKRQTLGAELQDIIAKRYDLIVRRKEIAYEQLLRKLDELHKQVRDSKDEIAIWRKPEIKQENVKERIQALTDSRVRFKWD